jgi:membrane-associated protein
VIFVTGVMGDNTGYFIGKKLGRKVFEKNSFIFNQKNLLYTENYFEKYGKFTFLIQRFLPVVRAFGPLLAGVGRMSYRNFFLYDLVGMALWTLLLTLSGFYLGQVVPNIDNYILPLVAVITIASFIPAIVGYRKQRSSSQ